MNARRILSVCLFVIAASSQAYATPERLSSLESAGFRTISASRLDYEPLMLALREIESRTNLRPQLDKADFTPAVAVSGDVLVLELNDSDRPWETTFLFYVRDNDQVLFLRARHLVGDPEIRLWSQGPSEVILSNQGIKRQNTPSGDTFRFDNSGMDTTKISATDALSCLANMLGLSSTNWNSTISLLTNLTCSNTGSVVFDAAQTLLHCFSMVSVGVANVTSTAGCILGATKLVGCGYLSCSAPSVPTGLAASDGTYSDRVRVTWNQAPGASTYTLYRSQSSGSIGSAILSNSPSTSYDDTSAVAGYRSYYYRVKACSNLGCSDISGYDSGWRSGSSSSCSGTTYSGSLSAGRSAYHPNGSYYESRVSGTHTGNLVGPSGADFDLYLYKWNGSSWSLVASRTSSSSSETLSYNGTAGAYSWRVYAYRGSGSYSLCVNRP